MISVTRINAREDKDVERLDSRAEKIVGLLEYTAMMADVELPGDDDEEDEDYEL